MATSSPSIARHIVPGMRVGGKYVLLRRIATGGMGDVWVARNETTDAHVALKILRPGRDVRTQADERFRREAKLGGLLGHRSIARIFDFLDEADGTLILVMELLRGDTLEMHLQKSGPLPMREALAIMVPVLSALQHGHEHGVIHRDAKPANIFLHVEPDGRVIPKLLDFGIAKIPYAGTKTVGGLVLGTPSYMSPEQIRADDAIDGRSDLFSVGVVLYELLTGVCPFHAPGASVAIAAVLQNAVDPDPRIDPRLWVELQRALAKRPAERHASAADLALALCAAVGETEDALGSVLKRAKPPPTLSDLKGPESVVRQAQGRPPEQTATQGFVAEMLVFEPPHVAPVALAATVAPSPEPGRAPEGPAGAPENTLSVEGQSVPPPHAPRRLARWTVWTITAAASAIVAIAGIVALRRPPAGGAAASAPVVLAPVATIAQAVAATPAAVPAPPASSAPPSTSASAPRSPSPAKTSAPHRPARAPQKKR